MAYLAGEAILNFGGPDAWRLTLASTAVIGALLFIVRLGTPESPRWLLSKGRHAEAEAIIRRVYGPEFGLDNLPVQAEGKTFLCQPAPFRLRQAHGVCGDFLDLLRHSGICRLCLCP